MTSFIVVLLAILFFIENRLIKKKQINIHYLCIVLFSLISIEVFNTLLCSTLIYWFIRTLKTDRYLKLKPFIFPLTIISSILLITGIISVYVLPTTGTSFLGLLIRNFVIMTFWPILIAKSISNLSDLRKVAYFYAFIRIIEVGLTGLIIYFFYYTEFYLFVTSTDLDISISDYNYPRLISIGAPNSNDAAFVLLGASGLIVYRLFVKLRIIDLLLSIVALFGIFYTWSRSVWVFIFLYFVFITSFNQKIKKSTILFAGLIMLTLSIVGLQIYEVRKIDDSRLQTYDNASSRQQQIIDYIMAIPKLPILWGTYEEPKIIASKLNIKGDFSSENYILETFTRNGIMAGILLTAFYSYLILIFWRTIKIYVRIHNYNNKNTIFVVAVFSTFISLFLMAQSSLFRNNLILWVLIGFMSVIKQQIYITENEK